MAQRIRTVFFWLHLTAGLLAGVVVIIMSATGALLAFEKQAVYYADTRNIALTPAAGTTPLPIDEVLARVRATGLVADAGNPSKTLAPSGAQEGNTDFGKPGYGGPCPPAGPGAHHYVITAFALKVERIDVPANATAAMVGFNLNANTLAKAKLTAIYRR